MMREISTLCMRCTSKSCRATCQRCKNPEIHARAQGGKFPHQQEPAEQPTASIIALGNGPAGVKMRVLAWGPGFPIKFFWTNLFI